MKTKKILHQIMACCLVLAVVLSMSLTGFAISPDQKGSFTVNGINETTTVSAYQVITVDIDAASGQPKDPMYYWADSVADWLRTTSDYAKDVAANNSVTTEFAQGTTDEFKPFWHEMAAAIKNGTIALTPTDKTPDSQDGTSVTFNNMPMGQYLLTAKGGVKIYQPTTVKLFPVWKDNQWVVGDPVVGNDDLQANMKGEQPPVKKEITNGDSTVSIGDTVSYKITSIMPSYPLNAESRTYVIYDNLHKGLTFNNDIVVTVNGETVTAGPNTFSLTTENASWNGHNYSFVISFADSYIKAHAGEEIVVTYSAIVNENAMEPGALTNEVGNGWNDDGTSVPGDGPDVNVYTYAIDLTKVNKSNAETKLPGAGFELSKNDGTKISVVAVDEPNGIYRVAKKGEMGTTTLVTGKDGKLVVQGLDLGTYTLTETKAPDGYVLPKNPTTTIVLVDSQPDGILDGGEGGSSVSGSTVMAEVKDDGQDNNFTFQLGNTSADDAGFELPTTGGMGTVLFTVVGLTLMGGAIVLAVLAAKRKKVQN